MFLNFLFLFFFNFFYSNNQEKFLIESKKKSSSENIINIFNQEFEKINICFSYENSNELIPDYSIFSEIFKALKIGGEIKFFNFKKNNNFKLKEIFKKLKNEKIYFYIIFFENENFFSWKIYSVFDEKFIEWKNYSKKNKNFDFILDLKRIICSDIWKVLFGSEVTPFDSFLLYSKDFYENDKKYSSIFSTQPFFSKNIKTQIKTNRIIVDLRVINNEESSFLTFSEITKKNVRIVKLKKNGNLSIIIDLPGTSTSLCNSENGLFYVRSSNIYYCYYESKTKRFIHQKINDNKNDIIASVCEGPENSILCAKNYKIYKINFEKDNDGKIIKTKEQLICPKDSISMGITYTKLSDNFITTEKIGNFYQLFSYDKKNLKRVQITNSNYSKNEISISPCGCYIAYTVINNLNKKKRIEIMNLYTKKIIKLTDEENRYISPVWILKKN